MKLDTRQRGVTEANAEVETKRNGLIIQNYVILISYTSGNNSYFRILI